MSTITHRYDTWSNFVASVTQATPKTNADRASRSTSEPEWYGSRSFEEALNFLSKGWTQGITKIEHYRHELPSDLFDCIMAVRDYKPELRHQIAGGTIDISAHLSGATPETFLAEKAPVDEGVTQRGNKLRTIYFNYANSHCVDADAYFYRGALTYLLVEHMENCGYSCEVWGVGILSGGNITQVNYTKIKEYGELFDNNKLVIALASPFMHRRYLFALQETYSDDEIRNITNMMYGFPCNITTKHILPEDKDLNPIIVEVCNITNKDEMLKLFRNILDRHMNTDVVIE